MDKSECIWRCSVSHVLKKIKGFLYKDCKDGMETKSVPNLSAGTGHKNEVQMKCKK